MSNHGDAGRDNTLVNSRTVPWQDSLLSPLFNFIATRGQALPSHPLKSEKPGLKKGEQLGQSRIC